MTNYWLNIQGCLEKYRDMASARTWLLRANRELVGGQFVSLLQSMDAWLLQNPSHHDLAEQVLQLLGEFDPSGDASRRGIFEQVVRKALAEELAREKRERGERLRAEAAQREKQERERLAVLRRKEEEREQLRQEKLRKQTEARRNEMLGQLRRRLAFDFLGADLFFENACAGIINAQEFEAEKHLFVRDWVAANTAGSRVGSKTLPDDEQVAAIAALHGQVQVIARAGSGKTTTLVNRVLFLLRHCGVGPSEILILAFNRKAAVEVRRRLLALLKQDADAAISAEIDRRLAKASKTKKVHRDEVEPDAIDAVAEHFNITLPHVMTFHALAYAIVHPEERLLYDSAEGGPQGLSRAVQQVIDDHLQDPVFHAKIRELMLAHFREDWDRIIDGRYDTSKDELLRFRRSLPRESVGGDYVKSYGEKLIADFLFEHDIPYKYERNFWWGGINYRPDFTIFQAPNRGVVIEYFGLTGDSDYDAMSEEKRAYWMRMPEWTLIEFSALDIANRGVDGFLDLLRACLEGEGIPCLRLSEDEIWHRVRERAIDRFTIASVGFIGRCRKQCLSPLGLQELVASYAPLSSVEAMFLDIAHQLYVAYLDRLNATGEDDFDGLMQRAADAVHAGNITFRRRSGIGSFASLRYLCIDEFQDFSELFYRLLNAIRKSNPKVELFCVGDDWQAINGFAGSDLRFFSNFETHIGDSKRVYISTNYRSSRGIVNIGNELMKGLGKPAVAHKKSPGRVLISDLNEFRPTLIEKERHPGDIITPAVSRIVLKALVDGADVVMLCRRNSLPWFVNYQDRPAADRRGLDRYVDLIRSLFPKGLRERINISTVHKYKGLEKATVILLDAVARSYPLIHPDWVFTRILGDSPEKITQEERRLLYVAMTRAVDTLVVLTDGRSKSPFLEELERAAPLPVINWADYRPVRGTTTRIIVKIGNQMGRGGAPTIAIKDLLKASRYEWEANNWPGWTKSFPAESFRIATLESEVWSALADGVEVRVFDDAGVQVARYLIDAGKWLGVTDRLT